MILNFMKSPSKKSSNSIKSTPASVFSFLVMIFLAKTSRKFFASATCYCLSEADCLFAFSSGPFSTYLMRNKKSKVVFVRTW